MSVSSLQALIQRFFTDRLLKQLGASQYTVAAYRDAFRLLLQFGCKHLGRPPSKLLIEDLDVPFLGQFLQHLEARPWQLHADAKQPSGCYPCLLPIRGDQ